MKRGVCSFVSKAIRVASDSAGLALMVNQDNTIPDTSAGKENTTTCTTPFATMRESDGTLLQLTATSNEVILMSHESTEEGFRSSKSQSACIRLHTLSEDIIDQWPHSVPHIPVDTVCVCWLGYMCVCFMCIYTYTYTCPDFVCLRPISNSLYLTCRY